jgi:plasmid stabilization system protein ParE
MFRVEVTLAALADIEASYVWMKGQPDVAAGADSWFTGISEAILSLETMPRRYPLAVEARTLGREIRQLLCGKGGIAHRILFVVYGDQTVYVLRVRHASRPQLTPSELGIVPGEGPETDEPEA